METEINASYYTLADKTQQSIDNQRVDKLVRALEFWKNGFESLGPAMLPIWQKNGLEKTREALKGFKNGN